MFLEIIATILLNEKPSALSYSKDVQSNLKKDLQSSNRPSYKPTKAYSLEPKLATLRLPLT